MIDKTERFTQASGFALNIPPLMASMHTGEEVCTDPLQEFLQGSLLTLSERFFKPFMRLKPDQYNLTLDDLKQRIRKRGLSCSAVLKMRDSQLRNLILNNRVEIAW